MAVAAERFTVALGGGEEMFSVLSFIDRRGRKPHRRKQWILVRSIERLLYGVGAGSRSTGAFACHLAKCSMSDAVLCCEKARVDDNTMTQEELNAGSSPRCAAPHLSQPDPADVAHCCQPPPSQSSARCDRSSI